MGPVYEILGGDADNFSDNRRCRSLASPINRWQNNLTRELDRALLSLIIN